MKLEKISVRIGGRLVSMTEAQVRDLVAKATGQRKPKLKRAADRQWALLAKTVAAFQPKGRK